MTERKFTDEDIVVAFESCVASDGDCIDCCYNKFSFPSCEYMLVNDVLDLIKRQEAEANRLCAIIYEISKAMSGITIVEIDGQPAPRKNTSRRDVYEACNKIQNVLWQHKIRYIDLRLTQLRAQREDNPAR